MKCAFPFPLPTRDPRGKFETLYFAAFAACMGASWAHGRGHYAVRDSFVDVALRRLVMRIEYVDEETPPVNGLVPSDWRDGKPS